MGKQYTLLKNGKIILTDQTIKFGWILICDQGKIVQIGEGEFTSDDDIEIIDVKGHLIIPGFIDVHIHGGNGYSVMDSQYESIKEISNFHAKHGTTSFLATTTTSSNREIKNALSCVALSMKKGVPGADLIGIHLEGPFINQKRSGAQEKADIRPSSINEMKQFLNVSENQIKLVTLAPEVKNGLEAVKFFHGHGITVSIGHSDAVFIEVVESIELGVKHITHHFNGMRPFHHREPGVTGAGLLLDELTCEIIADGIHVRPEIVKFLFDTKGVWNICAITDSVFCAGLPEGNYNRVTVKNGQVYLSDGSSLAGSTLTMIQALKNVISFTGYSLEKVIPSFTMVPARQVGIDKTKGSIEVGKDADLLIVDEQLSILSTYVRGVEVYNQSKNIKEKGAC